MKYSISNLKEVTDCIELLSWAERERSDLDIKRILDERFAVRFTGTAGRNCRTKRPLYHYRGIA